MTRDKSVSEAAEPRVWTLKKKLVQVADDNFEAYQVADGEYIVHKENGLKVIEYSAYAELQRKLEVLDMDYKAYRENKDGESVKQFSLKYGNDDADRIMLMDKLYRKLEIAKTALEKIGTGGAFEASSCFDTKIVREALEEINK